MSTEGNIICTSPHTTTSISKSKVTDITTSNKGGPKNAINKPESKTTAAKTMKRASNRVKVSKAKAGQNEERAVEITIADSVEQVQTGPPQEETTFVDTNSDSVPMSASNEVSVLG
jgi:beta-lactam-binding protein with PASTA domain